MSTSPAPSGPIDPIAVPELRRRLTGLTHADAHRLRRRLDGVRGAGNSDGLARIATDIQRAEARIANRRAALPEITYPADLPVSQRRDDLLATIGAHQIVVVAGDTGSGKTTQLPKLCLELGRGIRGTIGHTQPRRIAARSVAERVAEELHTELGETVGYAVRFTDRVGEKTLVKVMTDGILLAEIQRDRMLRQYDTIILDEAHERSLNVDFLLGYLKQLLPRRPELKLIITSATIDPQRFAEHFGGAPIIEVSGRSYPVEVRYRPIVDLDDARREDRDQVSAICDAVTELRGQPRGDILVFLSGEREIRDTAEALNGMRLPETEVLPLYARLSGAEQHRVFSSHRGRRIVLATNVAETSLTVPGIKYVVDAGTARISRYSHRTKVQLLPIEPISQASAKQRAGRCGRTSDGVCLRLYSEDDFDARSEFTDPEILRTNLASVILQMASLDLGEIESFGFIDAPDRHQIADGVGLLNELGALDPLGGAGRRGLTQVGRRIAALPVDPRLARMILEADGRGCVRDVLVLASALSIQDPRERPVEAQQAADTMHARFADPVSDFGGYLNLWRHVREQQRELSSSQFRKMCRSEYLNYLRIREWQDLFTQLRQITKGMGITIGDQSGDPEQIHRSLLAGLLSHIGLKDTAGREYLGARGAKFAIFPGSTLFKKPPRYVMAAELVDTSRLWARVNAVIQPEWAEELAPHLVKRSYSEPHWARKQGAVIAVEKVTLYGVALIADRTVGYHRIDPELSRELFIRHALVEGDWETRHQFFHANRALIADVEDLENRARRRDILVDEEDLVAFYDERIPADVVSGRHFDSWWRKTSRSKPNLLNFAPSHVVRAGAQGVTANQFPDTWTSGSFELELSYRFDPGTPTDGVTVTIPLPLLTNADAAGLDWQVPGLRTDLVTALLRSLPKPLRRNVVPVPDTAAELVAALPKEMTGTTAMLTGALAAELRRTRGVVIPPEAWDVDKLPDHLRPTYRIVDEEGRLLGSGKDLGALQSELASSIAATLQQATSDIARDSLTDWDGDVLPRTVSRQIGGHTITGYPALVSEDRRVALRVLESEQRQDVAMWSGTRQLLVKTLPSPAKRLRSALSQQARLTLSRAPHGSLDSLFDDCVTAAVDSLMRDAGGPAWDRAGFEGLSQRVGRTLESESVKFLRTVERIFVEAQQVESRLASLNSPSTGSVTAEVAGQFAALIFPGFVTATQALQLSHLPRYLKAMQQRLNDAPTNLVRDRERQAQVDLVVTDFAELRARLSYAQTASLEGIRWMIEELRVSLFAQRLGTAYPVSVARIHKAMDELDPL